MVLTSIDNCIYQLYTSSVMIYQFNYFHYYLLYPKDGPFEPIGGTHPEPSVVAATNRLTEVTTTGKKREKKQVIEI